MITVRHFAAAAEAAGTDCESVEAWTVGDLRAVLAAHGPAMVRVLRQASLLAEGRRLDGDGTLLVDGTTVDVLPPFAGG